MKQIIRLTESDLHRIVENSVKRVLRESGDLYGHYDDGTPFTNSKQTYRGVPGTTFISHGEWADPEIWYKGHELNAEDVEEGLWNSFEAACSDPDDSRDFQEATGKKMTKDENCFEEWLKWMGPSYIQDELDDCVWAADGNP